MIGSKEKHILEQENPNKFFFDQEKQKQKVIKDSKIQQNDKTITLTADFEILKYCKTFFLNFYSETQTNSELQQQLLQPIQPKVNNETNEKLKRAENKA